MGKYANKNDDAKQGWNAKNQIAESATRVKKNMWTPRKFPSLKIYKAISPQIKPLCFQSSSFEGCYTTG